MEKSFDFGALLQNHEKKHKTRPTQFVSVAGGVRKRLETTMKRRKTSRLSIFDSIRNLPSSDSPKKQPNLQSKVEHRRMQLEKWKEEKEKKKQQAAAQKKKPFVAGVAHAPLKFEPPPPIVKPVPSTSGRVTRSQTAKTHILKNKPVKNTQTQGKTESFAPKNASFKPPELKMPKLPTLAPLSKNKKNKEAFTFKPILPEAPKINSKVNKTKTQPKQAETKTAVANKSPKEVVTRSTRSRLVKMQSSSSDQSQSSSDTQSPVKQVTKIKSPRKSIQGTKMLTPRKPIPKSESSSEERLRSPKSPVEVPMTPEQIAEEAKNISPCVTMSRGKDNARREMKKKLEEGLLDEDVSDVDSVDHFRRQLNSEIKRMTEMCDIWEKISEQIVLPEAVQDAVLGAVGQARLLMSHKLQQFASLVERCERPEPGRALVTPADLHGFWDMVFMQVENVDMRFKKLEEMRARNWAEEVPVVQRKKVVPKAKPAAKPAATSRLRDMIAAARKAKKQDIVTQEEPQNLEPATEDNKMFEAGFFCVRSPVRVHSTPSPATPIAKHSLLKAVLSSEAKKSASKNAASLAILRASLLGKNVENDDASTEQTVGLTPINLYATPGRSILKPLNMASATKSGKKSIKVVLFNSDAETHNTSVNETEVTGVTGVKNLEDANTDSGLSSMDIEKEKDQKENKSSRRKSLVRQDATEDHSPIMTRSRRKSMPTPAVDISAENIVEKTPKRTSRRKKALQEVEINIIEDTKQTPKRSSRRKSAIVQGVA